MFTLSDESNATEIFDTQDLFGLSIHALFF